MNWREYFRGLLTLSTFAVSAGIAMAIAFVTFKLALRILGFLISL